MFGCIKGVYCSWKRFNKEVDDHIKLLKEKGYLPKGDEWIDYFIQGTIHPKGYIGFRGGMEAVIEKMREDDCNEVQIASFDIERFCKSHNYKLLKVN